MAAGGGFVSRRRVVILGATGSIGTQACDIIERFPDTFELVGVTAHTNADALNDIAARFGVRHVASGDADAICKVAALDCDVVLVAITGAAALAPTLAAVERGATIALANKEVMVLAGELVTQQAALTGSRFIPVDSEHSAIWQCLRGEDPATVSRLLLTASGGPFRDADPATLTSVTPEQALRHPNWSMGPKVTIDSATMMNKGLEVIEAHFLFGIPYAQIDVVIHPPSLVHSMVEMCDGATMAQLGIPDMRIPIALGINDGVRLPGVCPAADIVAASPFEFRAVDDAVFPAVSLARRAGERGGAAPAVLNAANEIAVQAFIDGRAGFLDIVKLVAAAVDRGGDMPAASLDDLLRADAWARADTEDAVAARA